MGTFLNNNTHSPANSAPLEDSPSSRSFLSRFALPSLRSRARNITDFHIRPADPHRKYSAGDHVRGAVILTILKPIRITHLTVTLHGYVRVHKAPSSGSNEPVINPADSSSRGGSKFKYFGNGFASLFEDEQVLSADGRLDTGKYEFNFDLMFPGKGLPSSIDFERGTISYMITATLTRPTSISPTTSCERKINLVEKIDIGSLAPPRARTIYLEPIPKRSRKKKQQAGTDRGGASVTSDPSSEAASEMDSTRVHESSIDGSSVWAVGDDSSNPDAAANPRSPVHSDIRSEISGDSAVSGSTGPSRSAEQGQSHKRDSGIHQTTTAPSRTAAVEDRTITATIELLKGGCLPGDMISVKISVQHIKRIKSLHGVIATFYRQGRIDHSPPLSLFKGHLSEQDAKRPGKEEYYPKSKTGLGGLSLSSAGSCSVFRKDLSQAFTPLYIDPVTLTASVTTSVRVPEDAFPTIKGIPGEMISFKYQLEVIVDLGGKLASQIHGQSGGGMGPAPGPPLLIVGSPYEGGAGAASSWGSRPIDTDRLRREKGVISVAFEVVVGTDDSSRLRGRGGIKRVGTGGASVHTQMVQDPDLYEGAVGPFEGTVNEKGLALQGEELYHGGPFGRPEAHNVSFQAYSNHDETAETLPVPFYVPPPVVPDERGLTEKERIRQAELRLLPSQPAQVAAEPSSPSYPDGDNIYDAEDGPDAGPSTRVPIPTPTVPTVPTGTADEGPSAPTLDEVSAGPRRPSIDKQELERQRLLAEASMPPEFPEDYDAEIGAVAGPSSTHGPSAPPAATTFEPSAPVLSDDEHYGPQYAYQENVAGSSSHGPYSRPSGAGEDLPRYER